MYEPSELVIDLPDTAWREIENAIGLKEPNLSLRRRLAYYVDRYYGDPPDGTRVRPSHLRSAYSQLDKLATKLADYLDLRHGEEELKHPEVRAQTHVALGLRPPRKRKDLVATLRAIASDARRSIESLPLDRGGQLPNLTFTSLIHVLAALYLDIKGKLPGVSLAPNGSRYQGPFFRFVEAVSRHLLPKQYQKNNLALGRATRCIRLAKFGPRLLGASLSRHRQHGFAEIDATHTTS